MELTQETYVQLARPFEADEIEFRPQAVAQGRALACAYIEARSVMTRLDQVVGPAHWSFDYEPLSPDGKRLKGKLTVCGVTKCDAGEAGTEEEPLKSAVSDALKRCAVHFGIGRYLYYLAPTWSEYDAQRKRWTERPQLPAASVKRALAICGVSVTPDPATGEARATVPQAAAPTARGTAPPAAAPAAPYNPAVAGNRAKCENCGQALTMAQVQLSTRTFGKMLCPQHQRNQPRLGDENPTAGEDAAEAERKRRMAHVHAMWHELYPGTSDDALRARLSEICGRTVESRTTLTISELQQATAELEEERRDRAGNDS